MNNLKLLIVERDNNEKTAIEWLISVYSLPINTVFTANNLRETINLLEKEIPDILYIELDMIRNEDRPTIGKYINRFNPNVIAVTAEATFERAKQAIEWRSIELLVKPLDPLKIKHCLQTALSFARNQRTITKPLTHANESYSYHSLFLQEEQPAINIGLMLLQTEDIQKLPELIRFLEYYSFRRQPIILPLIDGVVCLFQSPLQHVKEEASKILREWEVENIEPMAAVIVYNDTNNKTVHDMYQTAKKLLEVTFFIGYRQIILPKPNYEHWQEIDPFLSPKEQQEWIEMLEQFDKQKLKEWMHNEFLDVETPFPNPEKLRTRLTSILAQIRRFMKTNQLDQRETENYYKEIFTDILYNRVLYRIVQEMLLFLYELIDRAIQSEQLAKKDIIEKGVSYVESYYSDHDLTLEKVAKVVKRNPAYYSHLLMKKYGIPFSQLVTNTRIKEAKRLLTATELSIKEISHQVGFHNPNYFSRIFKESTGMPPREYRWKKQD
ncbi:helix-turn-helix domain-containing protein [Domibacillus indicus]|uniref:helix-turn-helix domain-containing protein n=1 Tax=Domibacillus indicus TaxID=1437523 RepID=UPI00203C31B8|nr:response regulator transcription factor [Domibacillus indicus]MCM3790020.1 helix-turn-helix domain-containing protein [Domibacillus indicus]